MSIDQKNFIYLHYVLYADPEDMIMIIEWLKNYAIELEEYKKQESIYNKKPATSKTTKNKSDRNDIIQQDEDTSFGVPNKMKKRAPPKP